MPLKYVMRQHYRAMIGNTFEKGRESPADVSQTPVWVVSRMNMYAYTYDVQLQ
jgi:hypothetical protein